jgi:mRNA-degrading endonuclease toxin of MazEF toxin-antitoxin module
LSEFPAHLVRGHIIQADIKDSNGAEKARPAVVVEVDHENEVVLAIAISSSADFENLAENEIPLPWHRNGRTHSGLTKKCVAVCDWIVMITEEMFIKQRGYLPPQYFDQVVTRMNELRGGQS